MDWLGFSGAAQRLQDKQADVTFTTAGWPTAAITELAMSTDIVLVPIEEDAIKKLTQMYSFYSKVVIPKDTYKGMKAGCAHDHDHGPVGGGRAGSRRPGLQADQGPLGEGQGRAERRRCAWPKVHAKGKDVQLKTALSGMAIPLHPGAAKYYKEKGLIK